MKISRAAAEAQGIFRNAWSKLQWSRLSKKIRRIPRGKWPYVRGGDSDGTESLFYCVLTVFRLRKRVGITHVLSQRR